MLACLLHQQGSRSTFIQGFPIAWWQAKKFNTTQIVSMKDVKDEARVNREIRGEVTLTSFTMKCMNLIKFKYIPKLLSSSFLFLFTFVLPFFTSSNSSEFPLAYLCWFLLLSLNCTTFSALSMSFNLSPFLCFLESFFLLCFSLFKLCLCSLSLWFLLVSSTSSWSLATSPGGATLSLSPMLSLISPCGFF